MCLLCIRLGNAFEPDWPDMKAAKTTERRVLFHADAVSPPPASESIEPKEKL